MLRQLIRNPAIDLTEVVKSMSEPDKQAVFNHIHEEYSKENFVFKAEQENRDVCAICIDEASGKMAKFDNCGHQYHFTCIRETLDREFKQCPICN